MKFTTQTLFRATNYIHNAMKPSPLFISGILSSSPTQTVYPLKNNPPFRFPLHPVTSLLLTVAINLPVLGTSGSGVISSHPHVVACARVFSFLWLSNIPFICMYHISFVSSVQLSDCIIIVCPCPLDQAHCDDRYHRQHF